MAQFTKVFFPYDPLPAQDLNDIVGFMNGIAAGTNFEAGAINAGNIDSSSTTSIPLQSGVTLDGNRPLTLKRIASAVYFSGRVNVTIPSGTNDVHILTLPVGYRPPSGISDISFPVTMQGASFTARALVRPNGETLISTPIGSGVTYIQFSQMWLI